MKEKGPFQEEIIKLCNKYDKARNRYASACSHIQTLKASISPYDPEFLIRTFETIDNCNNLPTIEKICKKLRERYIEALNMPKRADHPQKVERISKASELYFFAIQKRAALIEDLKFRKQEKRSALQQLTDIAKNFS